jgi:hypothetical protein
VSTARTRCLLFLFRNSFSSWSGVLPA